MKNSTKGGGSRVLAGDNYLNKVLGQVSSSNSHVTLSAIVAHVVEDIGVDQQSLQGLARKCDAAKARAIIGYLAHRLDAASLTDVAACFQRDVSTLVGRWAKLKSRQLPCWK